MHNEDLICEDEISECSLLSEGIKKILKINNFCETLCVQNHPFEMQETQNVLNFVISIICY